MVAFRDEELVSLLAIIIRTTFAQELVLGVFGADFSILWRPGGVS